MSTYSLRLDHSSSHPLISVHPNTAKRLKLSTRITLQYGVREVDVTIHQSKKINRHVLLLSKTVQEKLMAPLTSKYELKNHKKRLVLGPFLAIYTGARKRTLMSRIRELDNYTEHYPKVNGTILAFCGEGVDMLSKTISGYIFDPAQSKWVEGIFGYPSSILRNVSMKKPVRDEFLKTIGKSIINEQVVSKWKMHQWLAKSEELKKYLPKTILYRKPKDIFRFLQKESSAYVKPINGVHGRGIVKISKTKNGYKVHFRKGENHVERVLSRKKAFTFFKKKFKKNRYLVQKSLELQHKGRVTDFRVIVLKDNTMEWKAMGLVGKVAESDGVASNRLSGGDMQKGLVTLQNTVGMSESQAQATAEKLSSIAVQIGKYLDTTKYHFGNLGVDIAYDRHGQIWIIEVNHRGPVHALMKKIGEQEQYKRIMEANLLYAKRLAGF